MTGTPVALTGVCPQGIQESTRIAALRRSWRYQVDVHDGSGDRVSVVTGFQESLVAAKGVGGPRRAPVSIDRRNGVEHASIQREDAGTLDVPTPQDLEIASLALTASDAGPGQDVDDAA